MTYGRFLYKHAYLLVLAAWLITIFFCRQLLVGQCIPELGEEGRWATFTNGRKG